jgi:glycerol-3-phosphate dehydrogenase
MFDVAVVGGGVVGAATARLLSHYRLRVALVERGPDVGAGTSKANTAILHTGFDATPGSIDSRLVARGYHLLRAYAPSVGIAVEQTGALLVAWNDEQLATLPQLAKKAAANGYTSSQLVETSDIRTLEPNLGAGVRGGMLVPDEHLIDPWSTTLAFAREALANDVEVRLNTAVTDVQRGPSVHDLGHGVRARFVVNAAGLYGDELHRAFGFDGFTIRPRRGELIVFDKLARPLLSRTILPVPTATTKGVLIAPTVFGNVMLGPTADDIDDKAATATTAAGLNALIAKGRAIMPALIEEEVTAVYAGLRAASEHSDYQIVHDVEARYVCLGGIRSTGLTASMALAEEAVDRLRLCGLELLAKPPDELVEISMTNLGESFPRPYQAGGRVICHCEQVTAGEIAAACRGPLPATNLDGLRRRTRVLTGRCQGFYCTAEVVGLAAATSGIDLAKWIGALT